MASFRRYLDRLGVSGRHLVKVFPPLVSRIRSGRSLAMARSTGRCAHSPNRGNGMKTTFSSLCSSSFSFSSSETAFPSVSLAAALAAALANASQDLVPALSGARGHFRIKKDKHENRLCHGRFGVLLSGAPTARSAAGLTRSSIGDALTRHSRPRSSISLLGG